VVTIFFGGGLSSLSVVKWLASSVFRATDDERLSAGVDPGKTTELSDEHLMQQICDGRQDALGLLFRRHAGTVRGIAYRILQDPFEADDLLQDTFIRIHGRCNTFDASKGPVRFWIFRIAYNLAISRRRYLISRRFYNHLDIDDPANECSNLEGTAQSYEKSIDGMLGSGALQTMFDELSENQRQTIRLYFFEGYSLDEVAAELGQTRENVKHHYFRGIEKLRKRFFDAD
jgi:RNA polymerase sigma-70 factor, ECF subfamily